MDKAIRMGNYFDVSTDYLLESIERLDEENNKIDAWLLFASFLIIFKFHNKEVERIKKFTETKQPNHHH